MSFFKGFKSALGLGLSFIPFGFTLGVISKNLGCSTLDIMIMTMFVYAGNSQIIMLQLLFAQNASPIEVIIAASIVNIRYTLISIPIFKLQKEENKILKFINSLILTDETVAFLSIKKVSDVHEALGVNVCGYIFFVLSTFLGSCFSNLIPEYHIKSLNFMIYAIFITLLVTAINKYPKYLLVVILSIITKIILIRTTNISSAFVLLITVIISCGIYSLLDSRLNE